MGVEMEGEDWKISVVAWEVNSAAFGKIKKLEKFLHTNI